MSHHQPQTFTAFEGQRRLVSGLLHEVALAVKRAEQRRSRSIAGDLPGFEEASRALFADERRRFASLVAAWPDDIRDHILRLAFSGDPVDPANVNR
jgi:hypothetical protein